MPSHSRKHERRRHTGRPETDPTGSSLTPGQPAALPATSRPGSVPGSGPVQSGRDLLLHRAWIVAAIAILLGAAWLRLIDLSNSPFHNDEGVNGWFTTNLLRSGTYAYDPANYHGPSLYYISYVSTILFGLTDFGLRFVPAFFGVATIGLVLAMHRWIGRSGALAAAALLAVSPGWLYFSRYFIHEELLVCFTVATIFLGARWLETARGGFLVGAAASAALLFATKETALLTVIVLILASGSMVVYQRLRGSWTAEPGRRFESAAPNDRRRVRRPRSPAGATLERLGGRSRVVRMLAGAAVVLVAIYVVLYSSFFTNYPKGVVDSFDALLLWVRAGTEDHAHSLTSYLQWLFQEELPILVFACVGAAVVLWDARPRFALFVGFWAGGLFAAYSLISYKTPWLDLNFLVPMAILGGHGVDRLLVRLRDAADRSSSPASTRVGRYLGRRSRSLRVGLVVAVIAALGLGGVQAVQLSFVSFDDDRIPYVYAHTRRDIFRLMADVDAQAARLGTVRRTGIVIMSPDYWPLPWYWRDYPRAGFFGKVVPTTEPIIIVRVDQEATLPAAITASYRRVGEYTLRPGVQLAMYFRSGS